MSPALCKGHLHAHTCAGVFVSWHTSVPVQEGSGLLLPLLEDPWSQQPPPAGGKGMEKVFNPAGDPAQRAWLHERGPGSGREPEQQMHPSSLLPACR